MQIAAVKRGEVRRQSAGLNPGEPHLSDSHVAAITTAFSSHVGNLNGEHPSISLRTGRGTWYSFVQRSNSSTLCSRLAVQPLICVLGTQNTSVADTDNSEQLLLPIRQCVNNPRPYWASVSYYQVYYDGVGHFMYCGTEDNTVPDTL